MGKSEKAGEDPGVKHQSFRQEFNATGSGSGDPNSSIFAQIVEFAKNLPLFSDLNLETQILLIKSGWNELMVLGSAYRSVALTEDGILMGQGKIITMEEMKMVRFKLISFTRFTFFKCLFFAGKM